MLTALRHIAEAQDMANVAEKADMPRESLDRAPGPLGNATIKTLLAVLNASGLHLSVATQHGWSARPKDETTTLEMLGRNISADWIKGIEAKVLLAHGAATYLCCITPESKTWSPLADGTVESRALATAAASMGL